MRSRFLSLNAHDFFKGMVIVTICTFITGIYQLIASGGNINWTTVRPVVIAAAGSAVSYLTKNLLTNSHDDFMKSEPC